MCTAEVWPRKKLYHEPFRIRKFMFGIKQIFYFLLSGNVCVFCPFTGFLNIMNNQQSSFQLYKKKCRKKKVIQIRERIPGSFHLPTVAQAKLYVQNKFKKVICLY